MRQFDVCAGLPVSTTQTITGALLSIGLMEGFKGVNWRSVLRVSFVPWVDCSVPAICSRWHGQLEICPSMAQFRHCSSDPAPMLPTEPCAGPGSRQTVTFLCCVLQIFSGWVLTLFVACGLAAGFSAFGVNSPNRCPCTTFLPAQYLTLSSVAL